MTDAEDLTRLAAQATAADQALKELLVRRRRAGAAELAEIDQDINRVRVRHKAISEQAAVITMRQIEERLERARASADPNGPRLDMSNLVRALTRALGWRRDESCYIQDGIRKLPTLTVVAAWDDGEFIHFVLHVLAGEEEGFLGYCYEDDPSRWSWRVADIEAQEVHVLSDLWFYGENLVPKIAGATAEEIRWQNPVPATALPETLEELRSVDMGISACVSPTYFPAQ